jgi:hypothetical protein
VGYAIPERATPIPHFIAALVKPVFQDWHCYPKLWLNLPILIQMYYITGKFYSQESLFKCKEFVTELQQTPVLCTEVYRFYKVIGFENL